MRWHAFIALALLLACTRDPWVTPGIDGGPPDTIDASGPPDVRAAPPQIPTGTDLSRWDPQWYRPHEISLSGPWDFAFDPEGDGIDAYDRTIEVPFPWQSVLSGIGPEPPDAYPPLETEAVLQTYRGDAWYRRVIEIPTDWPPGSLPFLRFGAVDWEARVLIDGAEAAHHVGGYTAFEVPLDAAPGESVTVEVRVTDPCDDDEAVLVGKQGGMWYTCAGGIWQDVTLTHRPSAHLRSVTDVPTDAGLEARVQVAGPAAPARVRVSVACMEDSCGSPCGPWTVSQEVTPTPDGVEVTLELPLPDVPIWDPAAPCLLGREILLDGPGGTDRVLGYTARRGVSVDWAPGAEGQYKDLRNGDHPVHLRAVLDQGYHPEGIWRAPTRAARIGDLQAMKAMGFNGVRMHIKPEPPWYYAAADVLGLWVVYDMPCPWDQAPSGPGAAWRDHWEAAVRDLVARDRNRPSILWWVNFNEAWGLLNPPFWGNDEGTGFVRDMYHLVQALDPTRPVEDHSPGGFSEILGVLPHVETDVNSFHAYVADPEGIAARIASYADGVYPGSVDNVFGGPPQDGAPLIVSEMGGQWAGATWGDAAYPLHAWLNAMRLEPKIRGWVFTQLTDVEWETNGLLTYDRQVKTLGLDELGLELGDLLGDLYLNLGLDPVIRAAPGDVITLPVTLSRFSTGTTGEVAVELYTRLGIFLDVLGTIEGIKGGEAVIPAGEIAFTVAVPPGIYVIRGWGSFSDDEAVARQGLYLVVDDEPPLEPHMLDPGTAVVDGDGGCVDGRACRCRGTCAMSFTVSPPAPGTWQLTLVAEASTWDGPPQQSDPVLAPGDIAVFVGDDADPAGLAHVADAPADHRGVLSLGAAWPALRGAYGAPIEVDLGVHTVGDAVTITLAAEDTGVQVFFRDGGRDLSAPRVLFEAVD
jgi:hypothetical protein